MGGITPHQAHPIVHTEIPQVPQGYGESLRFLMGHNIDIKLRHIKMIADMIGF